jgi:four helix bundle protein
LLEKGKKFVIASQLLKAATAIGANVREAQNAVLSKIIGTSKSNLN